MQNMWHYRILQTRIPLFYFVLISFLFSEQKTLQILLHHTRPGLKSWSKQNLKYFAIFTFFSNFNLGQFLEHIFLQTATCIWKRASVKVVIPFFNHQCIANSQRTVSSDMKYILVNISPASSYGVVCLNKKWNFFLKSPHVPWPL